MKDSEDNKNIDTDPTQSTPNDKQKRYPKESIENISSFSRSEETITLNSSLSNIEVTQFNTEEKIDTTKKFRNISDFLNNRIKKNLTESKPEETESKSKENIKLFTDQQEGDEIQEGETLPESIYCGYNLTEKDVILEDDKDSIINRGGALNTTIEEVESHKQSENIEMKQASGENTPSIVSETTDSTKSLNNEIKTELSQESIFIKTQIEGNKNIFESNIGNNEHTESNENQLINSQNAEANGIKMNLPTNNKISQLFAKPDTKFSLEDLLHPKSVINTSDSTKPVINTSDSTKQSTSNQEFIKRSKQTKPSSEQIEEELQNLKISTPEDKLNETNNDILENKASFEKIEEKFQNLKISDSEIKEVNKTEQKASSIYDLLNLKKTSTENTEDPFAFLKKPLIKDSVQESKTNIIEITKLKELKEFTKLKELKEFTKLKELKEFTKLKELKEFNEEKICSQNFVLKKDELKKDELKKEETKDINPPQKGFYKIKSLNSNVPLKEYNKPTTTEINPKKTEQIPLKNLLRKNLNDKSVKKIPPQVYLQKNIDTNSIIFGQSLKSYFSNIPHNCQLIKFTDKYFKSNDYTEDSPENYLKLLYSNKLNLKTSLKNILLKNTEINSEFLIPNCSLLTAKLFIELINVLNKTGDIENPEIFEEFISKNIKVEYQFPFKLFYNCLLGNLIQPPSNKNKDINFLNFLNLIVSLMDFLQKDSKLLSLYALQTTKEIEHSLPTYIPFLLFMFYKKYSLNIFSFFTEFILKEELYTSMLIHEDIKLHSKICADNFLFSFVGVHKLSGIANWEVLVNQVHKECEKCSEDFLKWKYTLLGKIEEFEKLRGKSNVLSSIFKSVSNVLIGVSEEKSLEAKFEILTPSTNINPIKPLTNINPIKPSTNINPIKPLTNTGFVKPIGSVTVPESEYVRSSKINSIDRDTKKDYRDTKKELNEYINDDKSTNINQGDVKEIIKGDVKETKGIFSSLSSLIFGKPIEIPPSKEKEDKKEDSKSFFNFLSSSSKTNQTFKIKPQDTQYVYENGEWVSTRKIDKKKKHEEYMRKLQQEKAERAPSPPKLPELTKGEVKNEGVESKYPQKTTKFSTPIKKINIPLTKRLKPLIKARNVEEEFFNAALKTTEAKTDEDLKNKDFQNPLEKGNSENLKTKSSKTESVNGFDKI